ncbi:MAG: hypothetical protein HZB46_05570 [Solirubrobacterales bacterium]|nr:hypothetical protein [Solirubrobacterales bacterium]
MRLLLAAAAVLGLLLAGPAAAQTPGSTSQKLLPRAPSDPNALSRPQTMTRKPPLHRLTGNAALVIAKRSPKVAEALEDDPKAKPEVFLKGPVRWQVSWFTPGKGKDRREVAQVLVDDATGAILEAWNGPQVAWTMARGYPGAFGRKVNSPWVWIPLTVLFVAPFVAWRRPLRMLHLDLVVLAAFGVSVAFFNDANIDASVPIVYPLLAYLLARALWLAFRTGRTAHPPQLPLVVPVGWLAVALVFLVGFRVGLNITNSNVIDVGYAGVIGADKLVDGEPLYGAFPKDNEHGDTYGPVTYAAYVPFEQAMPWSGRWDELPAAHGAAIAFDLATMALLFLVGRNLGGRGLGIVLAYLWATWPFTLYALNTNSNDSLVALFAVLALAVATSPPARGIAAALGGLAKFGSLGLVPLLATHGARRGTWWRTVIPFTLAFVGVALIAVMPILAQGESWSTVYDRTIGFQAGRDAPFSIWGLYDLEGLQHVWQALAALLVVAAAFLPRRRDVVGLAAMGAAVTIALQLGVTYWFYLYLVWFFPLLAVALFARYRVPEPA